MTQQASSVSLGRQKYPLILLGGSLAALLWAYGATLGQTAQRWSQDPLYSHGFLVPGFALFLLWVRRRFLSERIMQPSWWGAPLLLAGLSMRLVGTYYYFVWLDQVSLIPCMAGVWVMACGRQGGRWAWPAIAFLLFMIPLPYRLSVALTGPLQYLATVGSTFLLQTLALPALADGTVIRLNDKEINIVEACSGLRMLVIFFALSTAVAMVSRRRLWQKLLLVASAAPIALVVNILRITVTGALYEMVSSAAAHVVFHDLAGWLMMPMALLFLALEIKLLALLVIEPSSGPRLVETARPLAQPTPRFPGSGGRRARARWEPLEAGAKPKR
jgi:exosortase